MTSAILRYQRVPGTELSTGSIQVGSLPARSFEQLDFASMLRCFAQALSEVEGELGEVSFQRTDRDGLAPYRLDQATAEALRTNTEGAIQSLQYPAQSPSLTLRRAEEERTPLRAPLIKAGHEALAGAFGEVVYVRTRGHELECPGCGYWSPYTTPGLLADPERAGAAFKTIFVCTKRCKERFPVTCYGRWGYVRVDYLLNETALDSFYLPRAWNDGRSWASRETLRVRYDNYRMEKEKAQCSE